MRMNQAMAEIHEMASGMISSIGGAGDTLNRLHEMVEEERTKAAGRARIAKDSVDMSGVEVKEAELNALADQALADFAAREGISIPGEAPAPAPRSLGATETGQPGQLKCPHRKVRRRGRPSWRSPTKAARTASSSSTATCTTASPSAAGSSISPATWRTICSPASKSCSRTTWATA